MTATTTADSPLTGDTSFPTSDAIKLLGEVGAALGEPTIVSVKDIDGDTEAVAAVHTVPTGWIQKVVDLDEIRAPYLPGPRRKTGLYTVRDVASFLAYFAKHAGPTPEIWVTPTQITAVLDAHTAENTRWETHRLILQLTHSPEWNRWSEMSGRLVTQETFADFLEDAAASVVVPDMATILEVAQSLEATTKVDFESTYRTTDGQRGFKYKETTTAKAGQKGSLEIPEKLTLRLRVYEGQDNLDIAARFRYRLSGDDLRLGIVIDRVPEVLETALADVKAMISDSIDRGIVLTGPAPITPR